MSHLPPGDPQDTLLEVFGHRAFRRGQRRAIEALESGRDVQILLPTGAGKSLCYQVPAVRLSRAGRGPILVVSPLIALMEDQVAALRHRGVAAEALHSAMTWTELDQARRQAARAALVYASPERLGQRRFRAWLRRVGVSAAAVDEAHCISVWGHDFRPDYLKLGVLKTELELPVAALTATATPRVMDEIRTSLHLEDPLVVRGDFARDNLVFSVEHVQGHRAREERLAELLDELGLGRGSGGRAVVYAATRRRVGEVSRALRKAGFEAGHYHAGRTDNARARAQAAFDEGRAGVLVATSAFGMGVDHPDVRLVAHVQAPGTLEAYYQEAGRAGRDGAQARCALLYSTADALTQARLRGDEPRPGQLAGWEALQTYIWGTRCRQAALVEHFTAVAGPRCGRCDACVDPDAVRAGVARARRGHARRRTAREERHRRDEAVRLDETQRAIVVEFVDHLRRPLGKRLVAQGLRGSRAKAVRRKKLSTNPNFGSLRGVPEVAILKAIDDLLAAGRLAPKGRKYPTLWIPDKRVRAKRQPKPRRVVPPLEAALRRFRRAEARKRRWKSYQVLTDATLLEIARQRPRDATSLAAIKGIGPKKLERFGEQLLDLIREHAEEQA